MTESIQYDVADALLDINAVGFSPDAPITFKSGIVSPVYVDNRTLPFYPSAWTVVLDGMRSWMREYSIEPDAIAGIEAAGIPHSAVLGYRTGRPSLFVRKKPKEHGTGKRVEGGDVNGLHVLLVEDLISTGGSSLAGVQALRDAGATVTDCIAIVSYEFDMSIHSFEEAGVRLHVLAPFRVLAARAHERGTFDAETLAVIQAWREDPWGWAGKQK
jgi:orotate phosphoribosyltransferase